MNPTIVAKAISTRVIREATTPKWTSETGVQTPAERDLLNKAERLLCSAEFCYVCSRCTEHYGEHTDAQILAAWKRKKWIWEV